MSPEKMREIIAMAIIDFRIETGRDLSDKEGIKAESLFISSRLVNAFPALDAAD